MTTYKITIKDNSIPEYMQKAIPNFHNEYTTTIDMSKSYNYIMDKHNFISQVVLYIESMATELDTDPESLEILSIIKQ